MASVAFEVFDELAESAAPVLTKQLPVVMGFMMEVATNARLSIGFRDSSAQVRLCPCVSRWKLLVLGALADVRCSS